MQNETCEPVFCFEVLITAIQIQCNKIECASVNVVNF